MIRAMLILALVSFTGAILFPTGWLWPSTTLLLAVVFAVWVLRGLQQWDKEHS